jgi:predicted dehydrogenase
MTHRVGIIGTENSHVDNFLRFLNLEHRFGSWRGTVIDGGKSERNDGLAARFDVDVVESFHDMLGLVDAVIVTSRDGRLHRAAAEPFLLAGIPVLVDKPLATTTEDASAILLAARTGGTVVVSASALRQVPGVHEIIAAAQEFGELGAISVTGPADPASEYAGMFFYGVHVIECAMQITGNTAFSGLTVEVTDGLVSARARVGACLLTMNFAIPDEFGETWFRAEVVGRHGATTRELPTTPDYNLPTLEMFIRACESGVAPMTDDVLMQPVQVLRAIEDEYLRIVSIGSAL